MIDKDTIAEIMGLSDADIITDNVYNFAKSQFYILTGYNEEETEVTYKVLLGYTKTVIKTKYSNIQSVDAIRIDNTASEFTLYTNLRFNPNTGLIVFDTGFSGYTEVDLTLSAYTHTTLCDYLIALLTYKGVLLFTPQYSENIKRIKIGDYEKELFSTMNYKEGTHDLINREIDRVTDMIMGNDDGSLHFGELL